MLISLTSLFFACSDSEESSSTTNTPPATEAKEVAKAAPVAEKNNELAQKLQLQAKSILGTLPAKMPGSENDTKEKIALGKALYFEKALSINDSQSCNSCHDLTNGKMGVDNEPTSPGAKGKRGGRNSPTSVNAGFHIAQFWDGRAPDLKAQAKGPILNPIEMGMPSEEEVIKKLTAMEQYPKMFASAFPDDKSPITYDNLAEAIASFERTLISKDRFDEFLAGKTDALNDQELRGLESFIQTGCVSCHLGATVGGSMYQKLGVIKPYTPNGKENTDHGKMEESKNAADKDMFKVPSLRNISKTAPYFHDGQVKTLEEAVSIMAEIQLGKQLSKEQTADIVAFLKTMDGTLPNL